VDQGSHQSSLASWVDRQRHDKAALSDKQVKRLDELGFIWDVQGLIWSDTFEKLAAFKERFGHCNVESAWEEDCALGRWVSSQRTRRIKGLLYPDRIQQLDELGFVWDFRTQKTQETWMKSYRLLEKYAREHGDPHVPRTHANTKLASWVWIQRQRRKGTFKANGILDLMTAEQVSLLDKLGFRWDAREEKWAERIEQLKHFKEQHGHCEVGLAASDGDDLLGWAGRQRSLMACGKMDADRKAQLDALGFSWTGKIDRRWEEIYERLKQYHTANGDSDVPAKWKEDPKLASWLSAQRQRRKSGQMSDEELRLLDSLGVTWKSRDVGTWEDRLAEVAAFKAKNGHCEIPLKYPENPKLGRFVNSMRTQRNSGKLSADRIAKLDALGFLWVSSRKALIDGDGISAEWQARFDELLRHKQTHGNCDVPAKWPENPQLGNWVSQQRQLQKSGAIKPERQRRLEEIGFDWRSDSHKAEWATRFDQLKAYKERFGNCRVPVRWEENPQLGRWATQQRNKGKKGRLSPEKERLLNEIGFD
jgi:hypothetical protein